MVNLKFWQTTKTAVERAFNADHVRNGRIKESEKGRLDTSASFTERMPHPGNMQNYEKWQYDPEANMAINVLTDIIAGVGFYTEMPEELGPQKTADGKDKIHPSKAKIDDYAEAINLDEDLQQIVNQMLSKGFSPVEKIIGFDGQVDLKILPSETFYVHRDRKGTVTKYTQELTAHSVVAEWKGTELEDVLVFYHRQTPVRPYGFSLLEPIGELIDGRDNLNKDIIKGVHRWSNPIPIIEFTKTKEQAGEAKKSVEDRDPDEWIFFYGVNKDEVRVTPLTVDPAARFIPYVELIYYQICEGLHAPLLLYLKNATEASATVMMESVDRLVNGVQRYVKRRVEHEIFEPLTGKPVPRLMWGKPQTGLEKVTMTELASLVNSPALANNQKQELLKQYGVKLPEPDWKSGPPMPALTPFGQDKKPFSNDKAKQEPPAEAMIEKLNDLSMQLNLIETAFHENRLNLAESCRMAGRVIRVHNERLDPATAEEETSKQFNVFVQDRLLKGKIGGKPSYTVTVN